eukprot:s2524_g10.t1
MDIGSVDQGGRIDVLALIQCFDPSHDCHLCSALPSGARFGFRGLVNGNHGKFSALNAVLKRQYPTPLLEADEQTKVFGIAQPSWDTLHSVIDACSGYGGLTQGSIAMGFHPIVAIDKNEHMISLYKTHLNVETVVGDIAADDTIMQIASCSHGAASMTAGFSCQPFSVLGDGRGGADPRSASLPGVFRAAFYLGVQLLVLECVEPAGNDEFVAGEVDRFVKNTGFHCSKLNLALQKIWPSRRNRAWWLFSSPMIGEIPLFDWEQCSDVTVVGHVIPRITLWDPADELMLQLNAEEMEAFGAHDGSITRFLLNLAGQSPCALHAWGNQLHPCPCGCRSRPLSAHRLQSKGLYGLLVKCINEHGTAFFRHAHPNEVSALQCMDPVIDFGPRVKLTLSAAGQIASPAQALWLFAQISQRLAQLEFGSSLFSAKACLQAYRSWILMRCRQVWTVSEEPILEPNLVSLMHFWSQFKDLSISELVYSPRWPGLPEGPIHVASILDHIIRSSANAIPAQVPASSETGDACQIDEDEAPTPWLDRPMIDVSHWLPSLSPSLGHVLFANFGDPPVSFEVTSHSKIGHVLAAQAKLSGPFEVLEICDPAGRSLTVDDEILPGAVVCVRVLSKPQDCSVQDEVPGWECGRLPRKPSGPFAASSGECGLLPKMPEGPLVATPGECGLLPKMPEGPLEAMRWECGPLPKMPEGPLEAEVEMDAQSCKLSEDRAQPPQPDVAPTLMDVDGFGPLHSEDASGAVPFARAISPTVDWTQQPQETRAPLISVHDVGECVVTPGAHAPAQPCVSVGPLLNLKGLQFAKLSLPVVANPQHLWSLRHQFVSVPDRLAILENQETVWADDEVRFHLVSLAHQFVDVQLRHSKTQVRQCQVVDPLVSTTWICNSRSIAGWAQDHPEIFAQQVQIITAVLLDTHWIPVLLQPNGMVLNCVLWDAATDKHAPLCSALDRLALALGFERSFVNCHKRLFFTSSLCGALAIAFIQHMLVGTLLPTSDDDARLFHARYRDLFCNALDNAEITTKPWQWGLGDPSQSSHSQLQHETRVSAGFGGDSGFSHHCISLEERLDLFQHHGLEWADDEIRYHVLYMLNSRDNVVRSGIGSIPGFAFLEPLIMESFREVGSHLCAAWCREHMVVREEGHHILSALLHDSHWTSVWIVPHGTTLVMHLYGHDRSCESKAMQLLHCLVSELAFDDWTVHWIQPTLPEHDLCGAQTICFLGHIIVRAGLPVSVRQLRDLHTEMRSSFVAALYNGYSCRCPTVWGSGPTHQVVRDLATELLKHGVPKEKAENRAQQAVEALGSEQIISALQHRQPWRQLKALGNNARFQFLLPAEFTAMVDAYQGKSVGKKPKSVRPAVQTSSSSLDPSKLVLLDGTFRANNQPVGQILPHQIGPVATGVALISAQDAAPFLKAGTCVSQEPLAILVVHKEETLLETALPHLSVTVPCKCILNQEPLLLDATLVQLGGTPVEKHVQNALVAVDSLEVAAVKILVYADEYPGNWQVFCSAPIKSLVQVFPLLKRCYDDNCKCECWHNVDKLPLKDPILDVWRRQHLKSNFKQVAMDKSEIFSVCIRLPIDLVLPLLAVSGRSGAYLEPRTPDAKTLLDQYAVIWTPRMTVAELQHAKQTHPAVIGLTRLGDRRGLRVLATQAQHMHQILKPDSAFLPQGPRLQFVAGPFPWGTDRHAIQRAMKLVQWDTKPLQPLQPVPGRGTMWLLQSVEEPPEAIVNMFCLHLVPASSSTKQAEEDLLLKNDPWGNFKPSTRPVTPMISSHPESIQQLEHRIRSTVLAKVQAGVPMEQDDMPERLQALEGQVQQLIARQQGIDVQFKDFAGQQTQQMNAMQAQLNHQTSQVHGHLENHTQAMQALFESQMQQIRGLLSKRPRDEGSME